MNRDVESSIKALQPILDKMSKLLLEELRKLEKEKFFEEKMNVAEFTVNVVINFFVNEMWQYLSILYNPGKNPLKCLRDINKHCEKRIMENIKRYKEYEHENRKNY